MIHVCYILFAMGMVSYVIAVFHIGADAGETYSDIANALMLVTAVLLLFRMARRGRGS
jgi:hypothetical protein